MIDPGRECHDNDQLAWHGTIGQRHISGLGLQIVDFSSGDRVLSELDKELLCARLSDFLEHPIVVCFHCLTN